MPTPSRIASASRSLRAHLLAGFATPDWAGATPRLRDTVADAAADDGPAGTLLVLLHHVAHSTAARNAPPTHRADGGGRMPDPVVVLDLHYLVAASAPESALAEALLERACVLMQQQPAFTTPDGQRIEDASCAPVALSLDELITLWRGLGLPLRPALAYRITTSLDAPSRVNPLPVVERPQP